MGSIVPRYCSVFFYITFLLSCRWIWSSIRQWFHLLLIDIVPIDHRLLILFRCSSKTIGTAFSWICAKEVHRTNPYFRFRHRSYPYLSSPECAWLGIGGTKVLIAAWIFARRKFETRQPPGSAWCSRESTFRDNKTNLLCLPAVWCTRVHSWWSRTLFRCNQRPVQCCGDPFRCRPLIGWSLYTLNYSLCRESGGAGELPSADGMLHFWCWTNTFES